MIVYIERKILDREEKELYGFMTSARLSLADKLGASYTQYARCCEPEKFKKIKLRIEERRNRRAVNYEAT